MTTSISRRTCSAAALLALCLALASGFRADTVPKPVPDPAPTAVPEPKIEKHDVLLMDLSINSQLILTRMAPDGSCRQYLRQAGGFSPVLPSGNKGNDFAPTSSPDGKWIAFYSSRAGAVNLWLCSSEGVNQRALTDSDSSIADFDPMQEPPIQFSPDSQSIAYLQNGDVWICNLSGLNAHALTHEQGVAAFAWAPSLDSKQLVYLRFGSIHLISSNGEPDELLAADAVNFPTLCFNPNAKRNELFFFYNGVWSVNLTTKKRSRLIGSFCFPNRVRSSPGGDSVAFLGYSSDVREEVFIANPGKKGSTQLTLGGASSPFYSHDGNWVYFTRKGGLWRISLQGEKAYPVYDASVFMVQPGQLDYTAQAGGCP
jgi:hypothetical protein